MSTTSDNDALEFQLTPVETYIHEWAKARPDQPFCFMDFKDKFAHGTIRNAFSKLRKIGLIKPYCRSGVTFYIHSSSRLKGSSKPLTLTHTVGQCKTGSIKIDLSAFLDSLDWEDVCRVHNVVLSFSVDGFYDLYRECACAINMTSKDVKFGSFVWSRDRILSVVLHHNGKITSYLKCSECPIEVSLDGLVGLASFLGGIRMRLVDFATSLNSQFEEQLVPKAEDWTVVQWHYGRDSKREISGPAFNITFKAWCNELARIYMRRSGHLYKARLEKIEKPRKPLPEAFAEKIDPYHKGDV
jgi:hypothetical protein